MTVRVGLFTDLHDKDGNKDTTLAGVVAALAGTDFNIAMGDMIEYTQDAAGTAMVERIYPLYPPNTYWLVGNHESTGPFLTDLSILQTLDTASGDFRVDMNNWTFLCMCNVNFEFEANQTTLDWLTAQLALCLGRYVIIISHAPFHARDGEPDMGTIFSINSADILSVMDSAISSGIDIKLGLFGHGHNSYYNYPQADERNGVIFFEIDACTDGVNYGILTLEDDGSLSLEGGGTQLPLFDWMWSDRVFSVSGTTGHDDAGFASAPRKTMEQLAGEITPTANDKIVLVDSISWDNTTAPAFSGSVIRRNDGTFTLTVGAVVITGTHRKITSGTELAVLQVD